MEEILVLLDDTNRAYVLDAACKEYSPHLFDTEFPGETRKEAENRVRFAKSVCAACPVRTECLADAEANLYTEGIWGGRTPRERGFIPRKRSGKRRAQLCPTPRYSCVNPAVAGIKMPPDVNGFISR